MENKLDFYLVDTNSRNRLLKYFKINNIKKKNLIDIKKIADEEEIEYCDINSDYFKLLIYKKIVESVEAKKDIYYIPFENNGNINKIKELPVIKNNYNFKIKT